MVLLCLRLPWEFLKDRGKETFAFQLQSFLFAAGETEAEREQWSFLNLSITWSPVWSPGKGLGGRQDRCSGSRCPKCPPHSALKPQGERVGWRSEGDLPFQNLLSAVQKTPQELAVGREATDGQAD